MTPVFAIGDARTALRLLRGKHILVSFFYVGTSWVRTDELDVLLEQSAGVDIDSGAFSNWQHETRGVVDARRISRETYAEFLATHGHRFDVAFNYDVIGDADASMYNWHWLCSQVPTIADKIVPIWHEGDPLEHLHEYDPTSRLVGLGRTAGRRSPRKALEFYDEAFNTYPDGQYHALGNGNHAQLTLYPFRRFDATSWQRDAAYGNSHGFPWCLVSKDTRMRAYIEAFETIRYQPPTTSAQQSLFADTTFRHALTMGKDA